MIAACRAQNKPYGTLAPDAEGAKARRNDGFTLIGLGSDLDHMLTALKSQRNQVG